MKVLWTIWLAALAHSCAGQGSNRREAVIRLFTIAQQSMAETGVLLLLAPKRRADAAESAAKFEKENGAELTRTRTTHTDTPADV